MKKFFRFVLILFVILILVIFAKDQLARSVVSLAAGKVMGTEVSIGGLSLGILQQSVSIRDLKVYNPKGFSKGIVVYLPHVRVDYDLFSWLTKSKLHILRLDVELKEMGLERNKEGKLNVDSLKVAQGQPGPGKGSGSAKPLAMQIDLFNLELGRLVYRDYSGGPEPLVKVYDINLKKSYKNITSAQQLATLILTEPMKQAGIKGAAIYGVSALAGVAILPVAIITTFAGKDNVQQDFEAGVDGLYNLSLQTLKRIGKVIKEDQAGKVIQADVNGASVTVKIKGVSGKKTQVTVYARKYLLPKPEIASGILYQISEQLK